jgi:hypothetical protein
MYLHLGQNVVVPFSTVVGVFDLDNTTGSHVTRSFLSQAEKAGQVINVAEDIPKSFIVCAEENRTKIFLSQLSTATLMKRSETMKFD